VVTSPANPPEKSNPVGQIMNWLLFYKKLKKISGGGGGG